MNRLFFTKKYDIKNIVLRYLLFLLPFIIFGIYKNGILLYKKDLISFWGIFKVLYLILISFGINIILKIIFKDKINWDIDIINTIIISLFMPCNINYLYFIIGYVVGSILTRYIKLNRICITVLVIYILLYFTQGLNFLNPLELQNIYSFNTMDLILGRTYGGIATTFILYAFIFGILSSVFNNYKFVIPLSGFLAFFLLSYILMGFSYRMLTNSFVIFGLVLFSVDSRSLPFSLGKSILYGIIWGLLLALVFNYYNNPILLFSCQIVVNILFVIVAIIRKKCYNMNDFLDKKTRGVYGLYK